MPFALSQWPGRGAAPSGAPGRHRRTGGEETPVTAGAWHRTTAEVRAAQARQESARQQEAWETQVVDHLPRKWRRTLLNQHKARKKAGIPDANRWLLGVTERIGTKFHGCQLEPGASYDDIGDQAEKMADRCFRLAARWKVPELIRREADALCRKIGVTPPHHRNHDQVIKRATSPLWWRRALANIHGRKLEACAIELGYVHRFAGCYVSDETFVCRQRQAKRNAAIIANTDAISEDGEVVPLEEIVAGSLADKGKRRAELMTRAGGLEDVAARLGFESAFIVVTCPSRMHARHAEGGRENDRYDGTTPREANHYLRNLWAKIRAKAQRAGLVFFGLRTVEPHHDGTPHWNLLVFATRCDLKALTAIVRDYALRDSPDEAGAQRRRVRVEHINPAKGGAVAYIAKYISKNLDGHGVGDDFESGSDAPSAAARAGAWASTWGIRQFQEFGCPPVGVWRELRRIEAAEIQYAPECVRKAWIAAQREGERRADYGAYFDAMGKPGTARRDWRIHLHREWDSRTGRYGEAIGLKPAGVVTDGAVCRSSRRRWTLHSRRSSTPWTRVNNCTQEGAVRASNHPEQERVRATPADQTAAGIRKNIAHLRSIGLHAEADAVAEQARRAFMERAQAAERAAAEFGALVERDKLQVEESSDGGMHAQAPQE